MTTPSQQGTTSTGGVLGGTPLAPGGPVTGTTALNNSRQNASFPTLSPPAMQTMVYAPDVSIIIMHNGTPINVSQDIVRGQVVRKENSCSSLFVTLNNVGLKYTLPAKFSRMDQIVCSMTRVQEQLVFSGYLDTIPWLQAYPGTVDLVATCTLKRLLHTWWNPALPSSQAYFSALGANYGTAGDGQAGISGTSIKGILEQILVNVANWPQQNIQIQDFPQQFITYLNNYFSQSNMEAHNRQMAAQYSSLILGDDNVPGPMGAVGYLPSDPAGTAASAANSTMAFYLTQMCTATDSLGMGPVVDATANSATVTQASDAFESAPQAGGDPNWAGQPLVHQGGTTLGQYASNWNTQNQNSDAAILLLAAAAVETGGGTPASIQMMANNADPQTLTYFYTSLNSIGTGSGLYLMANDGNWGTPAQRMNPYSSSTMFCNALNSITGWRNMDGGQAIWQVLQTDVSTIPLFDAAIKQATPIVLAYRQAQSGGTSAASGLLGSVPGGGALGGLLGGGSNALGGLTGALGSTTTSPLSGASGAGGAGGAGGASAATGPVPNSEGAINCAMTLAGVPSSQTPGGMNPPTLVALSFQSIGITLPVTSSGQRDSIPPIYPFTSAARGDVIQTDGGGNTGIYLGNNSMIAAGAGTGQAGGTQTVNFAGGANGVSFVGRCCSNGGQGSSAAFTPPVSTGNGTYAINTGGAGIPPGTGTGAPGVSTSTASTTTGGGGASTSGGGTGGSQTGSEPIARNIFAYMFYPGAYATDLADFMTGEKQYIDDQPVMQIVRALCSASLRNFQSAPNGDFIAYFPDEFGLYGKSPIYILEDLELKDCHIQLSDNNLTTHVYIEGDYTMLGQADQSIGWLNTSGVATVENPYLFPALAAAAPGDVDQNLTAQQLLARFGVRPYKDSYQIAGNAGLEFFLAATIFMGKWASQYETDIGLTFMPELYPGMRIQMANHNLQVYCSAVTHTFDWEKGFSTSATVSASSSPSRIQGLSSALSLGGLNPFSTVAGSNTNTSAPPVAPNSPLNFFAGTAPPTGAISGVGSGLPGGTP